MVAGLDPKTGEPYIATMDLIGCPMETKDFVVGGTCSEQLYGMCESLWNPDLVNTVSMRVNIVVIAYFVCMYMYTTIMFVCYHNSCNVLVASFPGSSAVFFMLHAENLGEPAMRNHMKNAS